MEIITNYFKTKKVLGLKMIHAFPNSILTRFKSYSKKGFNTKFAQLKRLIHC